MIILPAIDICGGQCVRLLRGDFGTAEKVAEDPLETALSFQAAGARWLHMVDLDGAKAGRPVNAAIFTQAAEKSGLKVEVGGGIRSMDTVERYLAAGVSRVILGSAALSDPALVRDAAGRYGDKIAVGIDAKNRMVSADGWLKDSTVDFVELAKRMEQMGVGCVIFTDISKDGTLSGPNLEQLDELSRAVSCKVVASGGISNIDDIKALRSLGLYGAICGKSLYSGRLDLAQAIRTAAVEAE
ncbi:MAG: 1-(5-phosphoribosyl)-5-[(5-phosphoribosylamino)methylideneamino]imidazole-4-carboxamide isomerase [Clostridiales bacterium]|nr:1-(5-phosphoribosyl)-5-[(5-phosphoribosylamino)methylideneamino]imidazole-4-carboxamide isomerase [Clostridiales bacterium]